MKKEIKNPVSLIAVISQNYAIGKNGDQLCYIPEDLKHFRQITTGHSVIMGRKTYNALPANSKPLPDRKNIILTTDKSLCFPKGCVPVYSIDEALAACDSKSETFIIGGEDAYRQFMPIAEKLYITWIYENFEADAFFPEISHMEWEIEDQSEIKKDLKTGYDFAFFTYKRKSGEEPISVLSPTYTFLQ